MHSKKLNFNNKVKKKYLQFIETQEILSEPFRDKIGQLKKFFSRKKNDKEMNDGGW